MTYVFGGTLSLTQSINQSPCTPVLCQSFYIMILVSLCPLQQFTSPCPFRPTLSFFPSTFPSNSSKTFEPVKTWPLLFATCRLSSCFIFRETSAFVTLYFHLIFNTLP